LTRISMTRADSPHDAVKAWTAGIFRSRANSHRCRHKPSDRDFAALHPTTCEWMM
jgi:hypothetical protein